MKRRSGSRLEDELRLSKKRISELVQATQAALFEGQRKSGALSEENAVELGVYCHEGRRSGLCIAESRAAEIESHAEQHVRRIHSTLSKQIAKGMPSAKEEMARRLKKILQSSGEAGH